MNRAITVCVLLVASCLACWAVEGTQVEYFGGTVTQLPSGAIGTLDFTSAKVLTFRCANGSIDIPYESIRSFQYSTEVSHHLGVAPAIAVGLLKKRQRRHFVRIAFQDTGDVAQVVVLEVPKEMPRTLIAVLQTRAPQGCKAQGICTHQTF